MSASSMQREADKLHAAINKSAAANKAQLVKVLEATDNMAFLAAGYMTKLFHRSVGQ